MSEWIERLRTIDVRRLAAGAAAAVTLVAIAGVLIRGSPRPPEADLPFARASPAGPSEPTAAGDDEPSTAPASGEVVVHAAGAVLRPGVYRLPAGSRVADLIDAAGGPAADADVDQLNLAAKLEDGARIRVPRRGEVPIVDAAADGEGAASTSSGAKPAVLDLNTATAAQLDGLPGIGPATAAAIVDYRTRHGRFRSVQQLLEVRGIGEAKLAQIRPHVRV